MRDVSGPAIFDASGRVVVRVVVYRADGTVEVKPPLLDQGYTTDVEHDAALEAARAYCRAHYTHCYPREDADDPSVVEGWL